MNPSNLYEQYFSGISRRIKTLVTHDVTVLGGVDKLNEENIHKIFNIVLGGIKLFGTEQYAGYVETNTAERLAIIKEIIEKECYVYYKVSSELRPHEVVTAAVDTIYEPMNCKFILPRADGVVPKVSANKIIIAPQYIILLAKTPEHYLATSSAKTNHYGLPVSVGPKMRQNVPYRNSPVKIISETEGRLYSSYVGRKGLAEMKDRANSIETHTVLYKNILDADNPTDIDVLVDRNVHPYGTDKAIELVESILNVSGIKLTYVKEDR